MNSPFPNDRRPQSSKPVEDTVLLNDWHVVAPVDQIKPGAVFSIRLLGRSLVLWANKEGVHAWQNLCIHRGAEVSSGRVDHDCLVCPYHGWTYNSDGACVRFPAHPSQTPPTRARTVVYQTKVAYNLVRVCLGTPSNDVPPFPEWEDGAFRKIMAGPYSFRATAPRVIENFLDVGHLPFVHSGIVGDPAYPEIKDFEVEFQSNGIVAKDLQIWQPDPDGTGAPGRVSYSYQALRPLTACFSKNQGTRRFSMIDMVTPVDEGMSLSWGIMAMNYGFEVSESNIRDFQDKVNFQDIPIVESQRPELLPLDLQAELHLRSDRIAIAYRQWLKKIGVTFGTC